MIRKSQRTDPMPGNNTIEIKLTPPDLLERLNGYTPKLEKEIQDTMTAAMLHIQDSVPSYPAYSSSYERTGTLGRTLTIVGDPEHVREVNVIGHGVVEGQFGTRLEYAPYVIGDGPGPAQAKHMRHWWTMKDVKAAAEDGIKRLFEKMSDTIAGWVEGGYG